MGSRQIFLILLSIMFFFIGCYENKKVHIYNCTIIENSIVIEINYKRVKIFKIEGIYIDYKNVPVSVKFLEGNEFTYIQTNSKIVIYLNLMDRVLYVNEEAELSIKLHNGWIYGYIVIEDKNQSTEPFYTFPNNAYKNFVINILSQGYGFHM